MTDYQLSTKVDQLVPKNRWVASLSNGETIYENIISGVSPAWERLSDYCDDEQLSVTNLRLQIAGTEVKLPAGQEGYVQKKVAWIMGNNTGGTRWCVGYVQQGLALIYQVDSERGSKVERGVADPGEPWVIYNVDIRERKREEALGLLKMQEK